MSDEKSPPGQPTTEEILASIRRIISEERDEGHDPGSAGRTDSPHVRRDDDILDLTQKIGDTAPRNEETAQLGAGPDENEDVLDLKDVAVPEEGRELVSAATVAAAAAAFRKLADKIEQDPHTIGSADLGEGKTLERMVANAAGPLMREWMDRNLPPLVERLVQDEIRRIAARAEDT